jgi:hypothetical protein
MANPTCPPDYTCSFTLVHPRTIVEHVGPWTHTWLLPALIVAVAAMVALAVSTVASPIMSEHRRRRLVAEESERRESERRHELALEEQRTMQMDAAKGNPETLKLMRSILQ